MFLHPWALIIGGLAAAAPVLIHWLTRPRPVQLPFSTLRFVRDAVQQRKARNRLRDFVILALRTLAVLLIAVAVAKPVLDRYYVAAVDESAEVVRVVVLDVSQSMGAVTKGVQTFERARPAALKHLSQQGGLRVNLILAGTAPRGVFERPSTNFAILRDELVKAAPLPQRLQAQAAMSLASEMLAAAPPEARRELVIVSDFQRSNWASVDFSVLPTGTSIQLESVATTPTPANLAIVRVAVRGRPEAGRELPIDVDVANYSEGTRTIKVAVTLGTAVCQLSGNCPKQQKTTLSGTILPQSTGWLAGEAKLIDVEDALSVDNSRGFACEIVAPPKYALITRQTERDRPSSSYFMERVLSAEETAKGSRLMRLSPDRIDREVLAPAELIVIDHPGRISGESIELLATLLRRGRRILYVAAEPTDATNLRLLIDGASCGLKMPVEFVPVPAGRSRKNLSLTTLRGETSPFSVFGNNPQHSFQGLKFAGGLITRAAEDGLKDDVLAEFNDNTAFLVTAASGACELAVLNAELGNSDLPKSSAFVPLMGELVEQLLGHSRTQNEFASGEPLTVFLPFEAGNPEGLTVTGPPNATAVGEFSQEGTSVVWRAVSAGKPGVYQARRGQQPIFMVSTVIPAEEADLQPLPEKQFREGVAGGRDVRFHSATGATEERDDRLWVWAAVACLGCLLAEVFSLRVLRT